MEGLVMAGQLILGLSILVTLHELGHFLAARAFGIKVEKFYLFFDAWGFKFFKFKKGDTEYGMGWLPLGGYVKIAGMIDESLDKDQMAQPAQPWEFRSKPAWQRLIVMIGGVTMNVILGIALYSFFLMHYKQTYLPNSEVKNGIHVYKLGKDIGLQNGDRIIEINGKTFERFDDLLSTRVLFGADLTVIRNGAETHIHVPDDFYRTVTKEGKWNFIGTGPLEYEITQVTPGESAEKADLRKGDIISMIDNDSVLDNEDMKVKVAAAKGKSLTLQVLRDNKPMAINVTVGEKGTIGIAYGARSHVDDSYQMADYTFFKALKFGASDAIEALVSNAKGLKRIFQGHEKATDSVQGPIGIAQIYGGTWDWAHFWILTGLLSMVLAFMNILPIPALDGGHVLLLLVETFTRKKFSDNFLEKTQIVGMVILLSLMAFVIGNDVWKHFLK